MIIGVNFFVSRRDGFPPGRSVATSNEISEEEHPKNTRYLRNIPRNNEDGGRLEMIIGVNFFVSRRDGFPPGHSLDTSKLKELVLHFFLLSIDGYIYSVGETQSGKYHVFGLVH